MATGVVRGPRPAAATRRLTFRQRHQWEKKNDMILPSDDDEALEIIASHIRGDPGLMKFMIPLTF
jgi:hypothetical protein